MAKCKFKIGDRVKVVNRWAMSTLADVEIGETGVVTGHQGCDYDVNMDSDPEGEKFPWSIPQRGLESIPNEA